MHEWGFHLSAQGSSPVAVKYCTSKYDFRTPFLVIRDGVGGGHSCRMLFQSRRNAIICQRAPLQFLTVLQLSIAFRQYHDELLHFKICHYTTDHYCTFKHHLPSSIAQSILCRIDRTEGKVWIHLLCLLSNYIKNWWIGCCIYHGCHRRAELQKALKPRALLLMLTMGFGNNHPIKIKINVIL